MERCITNGLDLVNRQVAFIWLLALVLQGLYDSRTELAVRRAIVTIVLFHEVLQQGLCLFGRFKWYFSRKTFQLCSPQQDLLTLEDNGNVFAAKKKKKSRKKRMEMSHYLSLASWWVGDIELPLISYTKVKINCDLSPFNFYIKSLLFDRWFAIKCGTIFTMKL